MIPPTMVFVSQAIPRRVQAATSAGFRGLAAGALVLALVACADAPESGAGGAPSEGPAAASVSVRKDSLVFYRMSRNELTEYTLDWCLSMVGSGPESLGISY